MEVPLTEAQEKLERLRQQKRESYHRNKNNTKTPEQISRRAEQLAKARAKYNLIHADRVAASKARNYDENEEEIKERRRIKRIQDRDNPVLGELYKIALKPIETEDEVEEHYLGPMDNRCIYCGALYFDSEANESGKYSKCCKDGAVDIGHLPQPPSYITKLLSNRSDTESKEFTAHARLYNSLSSFAKVIIKKSFEFLSSGIPVLKVGGEVRRVVNNHFDDPDTQLNTFIAGADDSNHIPAEGIFKRLQDVFNNCNPYTKDFQTILNDKSKQFYRQRNTSINPSVPVYQVIIEDKAAPVDAATRTYNKPTVQQVAGYFPSISASDSNATFDRFLSLTKRNKNSSEQLISYRHGSYDPLTYAIFHPYGTSGWSSLLFENGVNHKKLSLTNFYKFRAHVRDAPLEPLFYDILFHGGPLYQQYWVDQYLKIESDRLSYQREHQEELKAASYHAVRKYVQDGIDVTHKHVVLTPSFTGGPRDNQNKFLDSMAAASTLGKHDLFVTVTTNTEWREITENLKPGQQAHERPDIVNRVFKLKLKAIMDDITKNHVYGRSIAHIQVIEFQKRGLPHAHILITLSQNDKFRTEEDYARVASAEIPDPVKFPRLHKIVTTKNIHKPCGEYGPSDKCKGEDGTCEHHFPKAFSEALSVTEYDYILFRRLSPEEGGFTSTTAIKNELHEVDNRWVVSYNPYLSLKFNCHINVEICSSISAISYLHKYFFKGPDMAVIGLEASKPKGPFDEIQHWFDTRYIGPSEAMWRIFKYPLLERYPPVEVLPFHLPDRQFLYFKPGKEMAAIQSGDGKDSKLMAYFNSCYMERRSPLDESELLQKFIGGRIVTNPGATTLTYFEFPQYYRWDQDTKQWHRRATNTPSIGRPYITYSRQGEKHYLSLLLNVVKGAESFKCLRTVMGVTYDTFQQAADAHGLLSDDKEWDDDLSKASFLESASKLREMFVYILVWNRPNDCLKLWEKYKVFLSSDFRYKRCGNGPPDSTDYNYALWEINEDIKSRSNNNEDNSTFNLPLPSLPSDYKAQDLPLISSENGIYKQWVEEKVPLLRNNSAQQSGFDFIKDSVQNKLGHVICLDGRGGCGKTFLLNCVIAYLRYHGVKVVVSASTGIAQTLLLYGGTTHSNFCVPINMTETMELNPNEQAAALIFEADLIIIDEYSMHDRFIGNCINRYLQRVTGIKKSFGGKTTLFSGDLRQTLEIVDCSRATKAMILSRMFTAGIYWRNVKHIHLTINERIRNCGKKNAAKLQIFGEFLKNLGEGKLPSIGEPIIPNSVEIPSDFVFKGETLREFVLKCYPSLMKGTFDTTTNTCILTPKNRDAHEINEMCLELMEDSGVEELLSTDTIPDHMTHMYPISYLNTLKPPGFPLHKLVIKPGAPLMILRNIDQKRGFVNGTLVIPISVSRYYIKATKITEAGSDNFILIPRMRLELSSKRLPIPLTRVQFPVAVAFGMTINKAQGQTFKKVCVYLPHPVFAHGQLYVALSRTGDPDGILIYIKDIPNVQGSFISKGLKKYFTRNIVYKEAIAHLL